MSRGLYQAARQSHSMNYYDDTDTDYTPWIYLANAICAEAERDYRYALKLNAKGDIRAKEKWFRVTWFQFLTLGRVDPEYVIETCRKNKKRVFTKRYPKE